MSERARFFNRRSTDAAGEYTYSADDFAEFLNTFFSDGVVGSAGLKTYKSGSRIIVTSGYAIISGHWYNSDTNVTLTNPTVSTAKRKDSIALKLDKDERNIKAVWVTGGTETYPTLINSESVKYLLLANVELLAGGTIKSVVDKRTYSQALYTMSLDKYNEQWTTFFNSCIATYNKRVNNATSNSEIIEARGGFDVLLNRLNFIDYKQNEIIEPATVNLFDCTKTVPGWLDHYGSIETGDIECYTSDYISINLGEQMFCYDCNGNSVNFESLEFYREKTASGLIKYNGTPSDNWVNDCGAKYIRVDFEISTVKAEDLQITTSPTPPNKYIPYKLRIKPEVINATKYGMDFVVETVLMGQSTTYSVLMTNIAINAPVSVNVVYGGGNSQLVRADGVELIDTLTNKVVDSTMTDIEITADDLLAGLQLTEGGTLTVKYYNKNCEDLFNRINNLRSSYKTVTANYNTIETSNDFTVEEKEEIEV